MADAPFPASPDVDPLRALRRAWWLAVLFVIVGGAAGYSVGQRETVTYTAEARLVVGSQDLDAYRVAGYAVASEQLAANYARFVSDSSTTTDVLSEALGSDVTALTAVGASPIPDSNVIRLEVSGTDADAVVRAADALAADLVDQTAGRTGKSIEDLLAEYKELSDRVSKAQGRVDRFKEDEAVEKARSTLETLRMQQTAVGVAYQRNLSDPPVNSNLRVIQPAAGTGDDHQRKVQVYALGGAALGLVAALVIASLMPGGARRRRGSSEPA